MVICNYLPYNRSIELAHVNSYISASPVRIKTATLSPSTTNTAPHTDSLKCKDDPLITRRGCSIVLQITLCSNISCPYTVALSFIPVHGPRERSSMFKAKGSTKGNNVIWLSIDIPSTFPVGYYDTLVSITLQGCAEVISHTIHCAIVVLFNPWSSGQCSYCNNSSSKRLLSLDDDTYIEDENKRKLYCLDDVGVLWRGTVSDPFPRLWNFGQVNVPSRVLIVECYIVLL